MHEVTWASKGLVIRYSSAVTSHEMSLAAANVESLPISGDLRYAIHDLTPCDSLTTESMELTTMVARASVAVERARKISLVFVGTKPALVAAFQHFKSIGIYKCPSEYFATIAEARNFIMSTGMQTK
jgi:hypothetical protein